jgi:hypothetical protein
MREDEQVDPANAEPEELARDVGLRRALIDQHSSLRNLEQGRVALADVENRDA